MSKFDVGDWVYVKDSYRRDVARALELGERTGFVGYVKRVDLDTCIGYVVAFPGCGKDGLYCDEKDLRLTFPDEELRRHFRKRRLVKLHN